MLLFRCATGITAAGLGFQDCKFGRPDTEVHRNDTLTHLHFFFHMGSHTLPSSPFPPPPPLLFSFPPSICLSLPPSLLHRLLFARDDAFERVGKEGPKYSIDVVDDNYSTDIYRYNSCYDLMTCIHSQNAFRCNNEFRR